MLLYQLQQLNQVAVHDDFDEELKFRAVHSPGMDPLHHPPKAFDDCIRLYNR